MSLFTSYLVGLVLILNTNGTKAAKKLDRHYCTLYTSTGKNSTQSDFTGSSKRPCEKLSQQMYTSMFSLAT